MVWNNTVIYETKLMWYRKLLIQSLYQKIHQPNLQVLQFLVWRLWSFLKASYEVGIRLPFNSYSNCPGGVAKIVVQIAARTKPRNPIVQNPYKTIGRSTAIFYKKYII